MNYQKRSLEQELLSKLDAFGVSEGRKQEMLKEYAKEANAPSNNELPNWIFKVGINHKGERSYEVNGAFMYLKPEEMNEYRATIVEAMYEAEKLYRSTHGEI